VKAWGWVMADGPVCGAGFLGSVLQGALLRGFLLRLGLIVTYNQIPLFVFHLVCELLVNSCILYLVSRSERPK